MNNNKNMATGHRIFLAMVCVCAFLSAGAQTRCVKDNMLRDTAYLPKWEPHLSVTSGFMGTHYGDNRLFTSIAPSLTYRPSDRWTLHAGFRLTSDMGMNPNYIGSSPRSLAPMRPNGGTGMASAHIEAAYQVNDNMWLSASVYHLGGTYAPIYGFANGRAVDISATAISAAAAFRFHDNSFLHLSFTYIRDQYGTMPFLYHDAWMQSGCGPWGFYAGPADMYRMAMPWGPMGVGGWY